jgi:hypothetical protein
MPADANQPSEVPAIGCWRRAGGLQLRLNRAPGRGLGMFHVNREATRLAEHRVRESHPIAPLPWIGSRLWSVLGGQAPPTRLKQLLHP